MEKNPEWLEYDDEGNADITLTRPLEIEGAKVTTLRMREPTVQDQMASSKARGEDADKEIAMFSNLCVVSPADLGRLSLRDYKRVQRAFMGFID